jgi:hypothetical protein
LNGYTQQHLLTEKIMKTSEDLAFLDPPARMLVLGTFVRRGISLFTLRDLLQEDLSWYKDQLRTLNITRWAG